MEIDVTLIATGFIALLWVLWWFFEKVKVENLKQKLELEKSQKLLNDEKIRNSYNSFIELLFDLIKKKEQVKPEEIDEKIVEFMKIALLFAWPKTVKSFWRYRKEWSKWTKDTFLYIEELIKSMRDDLWVSNKSINQYDILQVFIIWDVKKEIWKIKK